MFSRKTIEAYLFFLLRHRLAASLVVAAATVVLAAFMVVRMHIFTDFRDLYPPSHPYIKLYNQYRSMFGTANTLLFVVEVKNGTIFDDPATVQKVDRITVALLHDIPGVNGEQVFSITHPKIKTTLTAGSGIKVVPLMYPRVPENKDDLDFLKLKVYTTEGVKGLFVSEDDKATLIVAGFWEEYFDLPTMWAKIQEIVRQEEDANTKISVSGFPILYAYFLEIMPKMVGVLAASIVMILLILWIEFRSWQGVAIPAFSGTLSAVRPLERFMSWMMVVAIAWLFWLYDYIPGWPVAAMFGLTIVGLLSDLLLGIALPGYGDLGFAISRATDTFGAFFGRIYLAIENGLIWLASGSRRPAMAVALVALLSFGLYFQHLLKVGDTTPGAALLYPKHPYNIAFGKVNEKFLGASQLVIIAEGNAYCTVKGEPCEGPDCQRCFPEQEGQCGAEKCVQREGAIKNAATLSEL